VWLSLIELVQDRQGLGWFALLKQSFDIGAAKSGSSTALRPLSDQLQASKSAAL
jgi:hypothetical protein